MGDEYGDLVELGFEGVDRFATHFHDKAAAFVGHHHHAHSPRWLGGRGHDQKTDHRQEERQDKQRARELSPSERGSAPPRAPEPPRTYPGEPLPPPSEHLNGDGGGYQQQRIPLQQPRIEEFLPKAPAMPRDQAYSPPYSPTIAPSQARERARFDEDEYYIDRETDRSDRGDRSHRRMHGGSGRSRRERDWRDDDGGDYERDVEEGTYYGYAPDGRRVQAREQELPTERREDGRRENAHVRTIEEKAYYGAGADRGALVLPAMGRGNFAPPPPPPPSEYGYTEKAWAMQERPRHERRGSSWSPPRRRSSEHEWDEAPRRRPRSKSPNHQRTVATIVGALAGGVAASRLKKGEAVPNTVATVAGAVVGGIGAREVEKAYDRYRERKREEEWEEEQRLERRGRRRWERERGY